MRKVVMRLNTEREVRILLLAMKIAIFVDDNWIWKYLTDAVGTMQDFYIRWVLYNGFISLLEGPIETYKEYEKVE